MTLYNLPEGQSFLVSLKALVAEGGRLLVLHRVPSRQGDEVGWDLPGGLVEPEEPLEAGLLREVTEETGLRVDIGPLLAAWDHWVPEFRLEDGRVVDARIVCLAYLCSDATGSVLLSHEHDDFAWASDAELRELTFSTGCRAGVDSYLAHGQ
ncbi:NUDIX domain-containing protein [Candidatus Latescibacterota bacterium]